MELLILFGILQLADIYTTHTVLRQGGREVNPLLNVLFGKFGHIAVLVAFKGAVIFLAFAFLADQPYILGGLCALYLAVVIHNWRQIK